MDFLYGKVVRKVGRESPLLVKPVEGVAFRFFCSRNRVALFAAHAQQEY